MRKLVATVTFKDGKGNELHSFTVTNEKLNKHTKSFKRLPAFKDNVEILMEDALRFVAEQEETLKKYPRRLWDKGIPDTHAYSYGLMGVENEKLTVPGLISKMTEWQQIEGSVDRFVYDMTKKQLEAKGHKMPATIKRGK